MPDAAFHAHQEFGRGDEVIELSIGRQLIGAIEQHDHVDVGEPGQLAQSLIHEQAAAVSGRTDRIG